MSNLIILTLIAVALFGCATPYQPTGVRGGFSELDLGNNRYLVTFSGNGYTGPARAREFAFRRAKELCDLKNMDSEFQNSQDGSNIAATSSQLIVRPDSQIMVQCISRKSANAAP